MPNPFDRSKKDQPNGNQIRVTIREDRDAPNFSNPELRPASSYGTDPRGTPNTAAPSPALWPFPGNGADARDNAQARGATHSMSDPTMGGESQGSFRDAARRLFSRLRDLPLAQRAADLARDEFDRMMGNNANQYGGMDSSKALQMSSELNQILSDLILECGKEEARLTKQTGIGPFRGRELDTSHVDLAVGGLAAIVYHFQNNMVAHLRRAGDAGSGLAKRMVPTQPVDQSSLPAVLDGTTLVGTLSPERAHNVAERLQRVYHDTVGIARRIQASLSSPNPSSPIAYDKAMGEAVMLVKRLLASCTEVEQLLGTGNTGSVPAVPRLPPGNTGK